MQIQQGPERPAKSFGTLTGSIHSCKISPWKCNFPHRNIVRTRKELDVTVYIYIYLYIQYTVIYMQYHISKHFPSSVDILRQIPDHNTTIIIIMIIVIVITIILW